MIVMLTALEVEYAAVRAHLSGIEIHQHPSGTIFETGRNAGHEFAIGLTGMGNAGAATLTERAIAEFEPDALMFVGVAGGLRDWLKLGDVVVATRVYAYHGGRDQEDGFHARPRAWELAHSVEQLARVTARGQQELTVHFEPIAAGEVVITSMRSPLVRQIHHHYNDAIAVEMESAGVANAGHLNSATPTVTVRGISDRVDDKDLTDTQDWQAAAARNAAAFAFELSKVLAKPPTARKKATVGDSFTFNNYGTGAQVGVNHGTISNTTNNHVSPREHVDSLTAAVVHAFNTGKIDQALFTAAMVALDDARNASGPPDFRRLRTLLGAVPDLRPALDKITDA